MPGNGRHWFRYAHIVVAAEDYSGEHPVYPPGGPFYLSYYTDALDAAGRAYDLWDVDAHAGAPDYAEVLSHYPVVIWYTGDDYAPTVPGFEVHEEQAMNLRKLMNYNCGTLLATGQDLAWLPAEYWWYPDDFFQYQLGAISQLPGGRPVRNLPGMIPVPVYPPAGLQETQIRGREGVGLTQGPHGDVLRRPRTDTRQGRQPVHGLRQAGGRIENQLAVPHRPGQSPDGRRPRAGNPHPGQVGAGQNLRTGEDPVRLAGLLFCSRQ